MECPSGPDVAKVVYTGGVTYSIDWSGACKKTKCPSLPQCDPPDGMPFSFLLIDDDSRGVAVKIGSSTIDGVFVDHWQHVRGPGMVMNW